MKRKVLIAEDNAINRKMLHHILDNEYDVFEVGNGVEALDFLNRKYKLVSAVLLDIAMPKMDGYEVLRRMRGNAALSQIPVIVATGSQDEDTEVKALALGANDYVVKPYNPALILHCLRNTINLRETASIVNAIQRDKLTGLYNREAFFEKVTGMIREKEPGYYLMACLDVDNFKLINDQYGAEEGDRILRHIGKVLEEGIPHVGGVSGRISADNFAVLYPAGEKEIEYVDKARDTAFKPANTRVAITFSVGRYVITDLSLSASTIYDRAYIAKRSVKGRYDMHVAYFDDSMLEKLIREQAIINEMNHALATRQFEAWFQPQFNHATGALIGAEALVRWRHPQRGLIPPYEFIPVFEQNGFIYELDKYMWERVCECLHMWIKTGRNPLPVSVNISRYDIFRADMMDVLLSLMDRYQIPVELLRIEITESAFAESSEQIVSVVRQLIERGFTVEIDDFGSGYSSLNTLKDVPANVIKLDMRFLENTENSQRGGNILESIVRMAKWLNMSVIAEGVEDVEQADFLKSIGCNYIQGYLYGKPMSQSEYEALAMGVSKEQRLLAMEAVENLDNNSFWNPHSMDTLIFNSYIGGACIFEYNHQNIELLRANDKYAKSFGNADMSVEDVLKVDWSKHLDGENARIIDDALQRSAASNDEETVEIVFRDLPDCPPKTYLRSTFRVIAATGDRLLVYSTNENITDKKQAEQELYETDENLRFLNDIAHDLLAQPDSEQALNTVLSKLLHFFAGARAYIFELNAKTRTASNTYEVCKAGVTGKKGSLQNVPFDQLSIWLKTFKSQDYMSISDLDADKACGEEEKAFLQAHNSHALIAAPIRRDGRIIGVIGIDGPTQQYVRIDRMAALGDYIAVMLTRRDLAEKLTKESQALVEFMNDIPGGFARKRLEPDGSIRPVYFNEGFFKLVGMTKAKAMDIFGKDSLTGVHPEDANIVQDVVQRMVKYGEANSAKYRLRNGAGGYVWVTVYGRTTKNAAGQVFLNLHYSKATAQLKAEEELKRFLNNLPCGAALFDFAGHSLAEIHLNQKYLDMLGRPNADPTHVTLLNPMHPDDRASLLREVEAAAQEKRDAVQDVRILYGNEESYRMFHFTGRLIPREGDRYYLVATYTPMADDASAYQEMLPVALNAVVSASQDMVFVKDRFLRYVCCNRAYTMALCKKDEKDVVGKTDYDLVPKEVADMYREGEKEILASGRTRLDFDEALPAADGSIRYVTTSKYPLLDGDKKIIGIYCISRDVTKAHDTDSQLKLLTDSIPGGLATYRYTAGEAKATYFNEGCIRMLGYTPDEYKNIVVKSSLDLVFPDDAPGLIKQLNAMLEGADKGKHTCRVRTKDNGVKWVDFRANVIKREKNAIVLSAVLMDVTELQENMERLRVSEEENRLAVLHSGNAICRFDIAERTLTMSRESAQARSIPERLEDVPYAQVRQGQVSPDTAEGYTAFYESILHGQKDASVTFLWKKAVGWRWLEAHASVIYRTDGRPLSAVISFSDVTDQVEKEAVYKRWQQSLQDKKPEEYTLFRCNLSKDTSLDRVEGSLLKPNFSPKAKTFNARTQEYVTRCVFEEDRERYAALLNSDVLLAGYYRGKHAHVLEYRENRPEGGERWLQLNIDLVEYPNSSDVEAYLMYTDIDQAKRKGLRTLESAEKDALTGALNRTTFVARVEQRIASAKPGTKHALLMLDVDGFKLINDVFGHGAGDQALIDIVTAIRGVLRQDDLLGRLGGDEFVMLLSNIPDDAVVVNKAKQICAMVRKSYSLDVQISSSIGIAVCPRDGLSFDALYKKADAALYQVKDSGKDSYAFYREDEPGEEGAVIPGTTRWAAPQRKRRILIVDDDSVETTFLQDAFKDEYAVEKVKDAASAFIRLRHYGTAFSVVLLNLSLGERDSFYVLDKMQATQELRAIPVIVLSGADDRETSLRALQGGASFYMAQPLDKELLRIRVASVVSKAQSDRQRGQNRFVAMENDEVAKYRLVLERTHMAVIGHDWIKGTFSYDPTLSELVAGVWDDRTLWHILLTDMVTDVATVKELQELVHSVAEDRKLAQGSMMVRLKTPSKAKHWFRVDVYKGANEYQLTDKLVITLKDVGTEKGGQASE